MTQTTESTLMIGGMAILALVLLLPKSEPKKVIL
jgi:hypothetical protein